MDEWLLELGEELTFEVSEDLILELNPVQIISSTNYNDLTNKPQYTHDQIAASVTWNITHNLGFYPSVTVIDSAGSVVFGDITHVNVNNLILSFSAAFSGKAYIT